MAQIGDVRTVARFAWVPIRITGEPWYDPRSWCHLRWYRASQVYAETDAEPWGPAFAWRTTAAMREDSH